ncbi:hypothetical protein [Comamonas thiooxydans]|uniref:hypothetical protein n=1 Tax=Comamonas thiooxydans TaxID=363952 RepID=UPI002113D431|nr:hypothetical protein [Comamonas thiooxydans]UUE93377.1 hypothetical protein MJ608_21085 [Comamonas thiooxydans]
MISQIRNIDWIYFITDPIISPFPSTEALHAPHSLVRRLHAGTTKNFVSSELIARGLYPPLSEP